MTITLALELLTALLNQAGTISQLIAEAHAAGATTLTADQWNKIMASDEAARAALIKALSS